MYIFTVVYYIDMVINEISNKVAGSYWDIPKVSPYFIKKIKIWQLRKEIS